MTRPGGHLAVMSARRSAPDELDFFPTPPWATRALVEILNELDLAVRDRSATIAEPACGEGHMAHVLGDIFDDVTASDVFDYGWGHAVSDFLSDDWSSPRLHDDWIITNPPFNAAERFAALALARARNGVALLVRTSFLEGADRHRNLFGVVPPTVIAIFCERVPMVKGRWNPKASSATSYAWLIWRKCEDPCNAPTEFRWIRPGTRDRLWLKEDVRRFAPVTGAPLFDDAP